MKWYTIELVNPPAKIAKSCPRNSAGQFILFDGPARKAEVVESAKIVSREAGEVRVFEGKRIGKLIVSFDTELAECTYCGKHHLD